MRRRSTQQSLDLRADVAMARARLGRTNSIYAGADTDTEDGECGDSCGSETEQEDTELEEEEEVGLERRHSLPSLHPMADLEMVKFVIRPNSSITRDHQVSPSHSSVDIYSTSTPQKPRSQQLGYDSSKPRDIPTIVVTVPHDEERGPSNGWEAGYKHFLFRSLDTAAASSNNNPNLGRKNEFVKRKGVYYSVEGYHSHLRRRKSLEK